MRFQCKNDFHPHPGPAARPCSFPCKRAGASVNGGNCWKIQRSPPKCTTTVPAHTRLGDGKAVFIAPQSTPWNSAAVGKGNFYPLEINGLSPGRSMLGRRTAAPRTPAWAKSTVASTYPASGCSTSWRWAGLCTRSAVSMPLTCAS